MLYYCFNGVAYSHTLQTLMHVSLMHMSINTVGKIYNDFIIVYVLLCVRFLWILQVNLNACFCFSVFFNEQEQCFVYLLIDEWCVAVESGTDESTNRNYFFFLK